MFVSRRLTIIFCSNLFFIYELQSRRTIANCTMCSQRKFIDIGINLNDPMFQGIYNERKRHEPDIESVLKRAVNVGLDKMIITGVNLENSKAALKLAETNKMLFSTVGCHPTQCDDFDQSGDAELYLNSLLELAQSNKEKIVAIGECGLDYDRLHYCTKDVQKRYFEKQLQMTENLSIPLFLHCRNSGEDFISIMEKYKHLTGGVVHSFDDTAEVMMKLIDLGYHIGINGCSLKTQANLDVVKEIPKDRLLIETDSPWCEVRPSHAGAQYIKTQFPKVKKEKWEPGCMVRSRNEPCTILQVMEIIAAVRNEDLDELCKQIYENTEKLFFKK